ncbi:chloride channel protein [Cytophagaceae bacterium DM2B3-1]|uniref:Chloride channel protein n=1 Tax=Xanthocytophaga flava TaxID=3048013 RepID=A0ABT7CGX2_9BACT|nr:chloride channel protein [Xanthocytophaga flavus]MDJ1492994.1 chloride channel protein [Xanthocytophaga flavus]
MSETTKPHTSGNILSSLSSSHTNTSANTHSTSIKRILFITGLAFINAIIVGGISKVLVMLIGLFTNLFFFGHISFHESSPAENTLGYGVIFIPVLGGLIVGVMARFGSRAIRGHGIPEAMEKIVAGESKIHPLITILKPLSAAISIGTGGPFGAEGPIISTGGALGSFCGQTLHITTQERKILLASGASAGMTAIFGTPFAAILLAIELLLFEFSAKSFLPVMIACITGACMHFVLFSSLPVFGMTQVPAVTTTAIIAYAAIGIVVGLASVFVTKAVYWIEDLFEKLPIHWMWWPAIGGIAVGIVGYIAPRTLGVGYNNITDALSGNLPLSILVSLCFWKFISWAIALGSGTSGGTLAPLLTMGSALGCLLGTCIQHLFPQVAIFIPLAALVGMAALFAGASRAILTSIVFAVETTMQESTLLPLIAACSTAYLVSFILMRTTIMTEKIKRRGIPLPENYRPDVLELSTVATIVRPVEERFLTASTNERIADLLKADKQSGNNKDQKWILVQQDRSLVGIIDKHMLDKVGDIGQEVSSVMEQNMATVYLEDSLETALERMLVSNQSILPVVERDTKDLLGVITEWDILKVFEKRFIEDKHIHQHISIRNKALRLVRKQQPA